MIDPATAEFFDGIVANFPALDEEGERLSLTLYRELARGEPVPLAVLSEKADLSPALVSEKLKAWPGVHTTEDGDIKGYWGLAVEETRHKLRVDGRELFAWCAWDTLFLPPLIDHDVIVETADPVTKTTLRFPVTRRGETPDFDPRWRLSVLPLTADMTGNIVSNFCHYIHLFESEASGQQFVGNSPGTFLIDFADAWELSCMRNRKQYPSIF